ncbi:PREDICTED: RNA-binding protein 12B [Cyprinodon variegatus]|uniref:RNA-binding protein 12B n=1 Tax=Cyprinodon variegatus TaxID=28743 RepID=UPI000742B0E1|nr:PREDICTED: RNA-binding protein 12B [Cyprinodon variegatus]
MSTILRLEGLDVKAGTQDIREFFKSLHIPDGGVYIMGGSLGEAFIAFANENDAQIALLHNGNFLKGSMVFLHASSIKEMEQKLESFGKKTVSPERKTQYPAADKMPSPHDGSVEFKSKSNPNDVSKSKLKDGRMTKMKPKPRREDPKMAKGKTTSRSHYTSVASSFDPETTSLPAAYAKHFQLSTVNKQFSNEKPLDTSTAFLLGVCSVLKSLKSETTVPAFELNKDVSTTLSGDVRSPKHTSDLKPGYVRLFGLPSSTTKEEICTFFKGLHVKEVIVNVELGKGHGCLVKFANMQDASDALSFNLKLLGSFCVEVRGGDQKMWDRALQECRNALDAWPSNQYQRSKEREKYERKSVSPLQRKRSADNQVHLEPLKKPRRDTETDSSLLKTSEYTVMVRNLPKTITKTEIKELFACTHIPHRNVLHLLDEAGDLTDTAFLIFNRRQDFDYAINLSGCHAGSGAIEVTSITKQIMWGMVAKNNPRNRRTGPTDPRLHSHLRKPDQQKTGTQRRESQTNMAQRYIFIRNMPANVKRSQIRSLFCKFNLSLDDIMLLHDSEGRGRGEAVVTFESEQQAAEAQRMHGEEFLGTSVLLTLINGEQVENILNN